ncbi:MAG: hypothetical protein HGA54_09875 [Actinobacteria bacterium]|nr:hypothetical protein [Actinomycetota bacterium]
MDPLDFNERIAVGPFNHRLEPVRPWVCDGVEMRFVDTPNKRYRYIRENQMATSALGYTSAYKDGACADMLLRDLQRVDVNRPDSILTFCHTYGLLFSPIANGIPYQERLYTLKYWQLAKNLSAPIRSKELLVKSARESAQREFNKRGDFFNETYVADKTAAAVDAEVTLLARIVSNEELYYFLDPSSENVSGVAESISLQEEFFDSGEEFIGRFASLAEVKATILILQRILRLFSLLDKNTTYLSLYKKLCNASLLEEDIIEAADDSPTLQSYVSYFVLQQAVHYVNLGRGRSAASLHIVAREGRRSSGGSAAEAFAPGSLIETLCTLLHNVLMREVPMRTCKRKSCSSFFQPKDDRRYCTPQCREATLRWSDIFTLEV